MPDQSRLNQYLSHYFSDKKWGGLPEYLPLFNHWDQIVGPLASHCRLADIEKGVLLIETDHQGWVQKFQFEEESILKEINRRFPNLKIRSWRYKMVTSVFEKPEQTPTPWIDVEENQEKIERKFEIPENNPELEALLKKLDP